MVALDSTNTSALPEDSQPLLPSHNNHTFPNEKQSTTTVIAPDDDNNNNNATTRVSKVKSTVKNLSTTKKVLLTVGLAYASYNIMRFAAHGMHSQGPHHHGHGRHGPSAFGGRDCGGKGFGRHGRGDGPPGFGGWGRHDEGPRFDAENMDVDGPREHGRGGRGRGGPHGGEGRHGGPPDEQRGQGGSSGWLGWFTGGRGGHRDGDEMQHGGPGGRHGRGRGRGGPREEPTVTQLAFIESGEPSILSAGDLDIIYANAEPIEIDLATPYYNFEGVKRIVINHVADAGIVGTVRISKAAAGEVDAAEVEKRQIGEITEGVEKIWEFVESDTEDVESTTEAEVEGQDDDDKHRRGRHGGKHGRGWRQLTRPANAEKTIIKVHTSLSQASSESSDFTLAKSIATPSVEISQTARFVELNFAAPDADLAAYATMEPRYHVEIILPASATENVIPGLTINGQDVVLLIDDSAAGTHIRKLDVDARSMDVCIGAECTGSISVGEGHIELSVGDLKGDYEVLKELILKTTVGNVEANIVVLPIGHPHNGTHGPHNDTHPGPPPHKGPKGPKGAKGPGKGDKHDKKGPKEPKGSKFQYEKRGEEDLATEAFSDSDEMDEFDAFENFGEREEEGLMEIQDFDRDFSKDKGPKKPKHDKPKHDDKDKHGKGPKHGPPGPHGPPPAIVKAFSVTGSVTLNYVSQPSNRTLISKAISETGAVTVNLAPEYKGKFIAGAKVGSVTFANESDAVVKIVKEEKTATGAFLKGFTHPKGFNGTFPHPHRADGEVEETDDVEDSDFDLYAFTEDRRGGRFHESGKRGPKEGRVDKERRSGWRGHGKRSSSDDEKKGKKEKHGRHGDDHKGPGGPPFPKHHKGSGGSHKGPGGPPPHGPPPPPGFSFSAAFTKVGTVALTV